MPIPATERPERPLPAPAARSAGAARGVTVPFAVAAAIGTSALVAGPAQAHTVRPGETVSHIAARTGTTTAAIVAANRLDARATIKVGQTLVIPGAADPATSPRPAAGSYTVRPGDTVSHIAVRTGATVAGIVAANGLDARATIRAGQRLSIPAGAGAAAAPVAATTTGPAAATYTVKPGDTISHIAARSDFTVQQLLSANGLSASDVIRPGQRLTLPGTAAPAAAPAPSTRPAGKYTVKAGDTLSHVAARHGTTEAALRAANPGLDARATIWVGQVLAVPGGNAPMPNTFAGRTYPAAVVQAATANRDILAARSVPSREQMQQIIADTARAWKVDPALAQAIAYQESGFNMRAVSPANAVGAMQVIPSSGVWASELSGQKIDLLDPSDNATAGVVILRSLLRSAPDHATAIAGYYQGLSSVRKNGMYADTRRYVVNVQTLMTRFR